MKFIFLAMLNLISLFRGIGLNENPYSFGKGSFWKVTGPLGFFLGSKISGGDYENTKIPYIIGIIFNLAILITLILI